MAENEHTSAEIATLAGYILAGGGYSQKDVMALAASCLTQAPDHKAGVNVRDPGYPNETRVQAVRFAIQAGAQSPERIVADAAIFEAYLNG